jgi:anthranilate 1,2-dioxygenase small subunit
VNREARIDALLRAAEIDRFNLVYAQALDEQRLMDWVDMFTEDALYVVLSKENADRDWPVGLIYCEGRGMIHDRAFALLKTEMFGPRYTRHIIGNALVEPPQEDGTISARASFAVLQVQMDNPVATLHQVGTYDDVFAYEDSVLKLKQRRAVYDNLLIDTALCIPI